MDGQGRFTGTLRTVNLYDTSARVSPHAQSGIQRDGTRRNHIHLFHVVVTQFHDRTLSEVLLYLVHRRLQGFQLLRIRSAAPSGFFFFLCHNLFYNQIIYVSAPGSTPTRDAIRDILH